MNIVQLVYKTNKLNFKLKSMKFYLYKKMNKS